MPIENKQDMLLKKLMVFYKKTENMKQFMNVINNTDGISLRIIDYLCTNYAKTCDVVYYIDKKTPFNLYLQYRSQLKAYSKLQFDPFRRHTRIKISVPESLCPSGSLETTVAQLNFFKWAIENKVIAYLQDKENFKQVEEHMNAVTKPKCKKDNTSKMHIKSKKNVSAKRHNINVTVTFR
jgi:hypothetical protein